MRMWSQFPMSLVVALGAAALFAQDSPKKEPTGQEKLWNAIHEQCCPKAGKCEGKDKEACDHVKDTVLATAARCMEKCQKEGMKCEECAKAKDGGPCQMCRELTVKTLLPLIKKQAAAKDATHSLPTPDGHNETVKCTLLAGPACNGCAEEWSDALVKACKEAMKKEPAKK